MSLPEDLKAELERALAVLPCTCDVAYKSRGLIAPDCSHCQYMDEVRAAIQPILERLVRDRDFHEDYKIRYQRERDELQAKLAATEAERDERDRLAIDAGNRHLAEVIVLEQRLEKAEAELTTLGGACAK